MGFYPLPPFSGPTKEKPENDPIEPENSGLGFFKGLIIASVLGALAWFCILCPFFMD